MLILYFIFEIKKKKVNLKKNQFQFQFVLQSILNLNNNLFYNQYFHNNNNNIIDNKRININKLISISKKNFYFIFNNLKKIGVI